MEPESSTSAVLEPQAAGVTAEKSPLSPETSQSPKEGENKSAEKPPSEKTEEGKSSQQPPSTDSDEDSEKDGVVNVHAHRRIKTERNELRTKLRDFSELGIKSKDDLETLLQEAETSETEAREHGIREVTDWIVKTPHNFLVDLHQKHPDAYEQIVHNSVASFVAALSGSNRELAEQIRVAAQEFFGNSPGTRAPKDSANDAVNQERSAIQSEKEALFREQAGSEVSSAIKSKLQELTKGLEFRSDKQRERFVSSILDSASQALNRNGLFTRQWDRLRDVRSLNPSQLRERRREAVDLHLKHVSDDLLKRLIDEERDALGVSIANKPPDPNGERKEVNGGGAPPTGKGLTKDVRDKKYTEIIGQYGSGTLAQQKYAEWLMEQRA